MQVIAAPLPADSLLARLRGPECYRDAFRIDLPGRIDLAQYIAAFYASAAFTPERHLLGLIGRGATRADIAALAEGQAERFAAWSVEARTGNEIVLRDFQNRTCSWLMVEPAGQGATKLWFGSGVRAPEGRMVQALMPFHRWYSRRLLASAAAPLKRNRG